VACGYHFPKDWTIENIYSYIDPSKKNIKEIKIIQNKLGLSSGKILFTFNSLEVMKKYILRYSEDFIETSNSVHRVLLRPF
jgi:argininosuccinate lyase